MPTNLFCVDKKFSKPVALYREKNGINRFIEAILEKYDYCKKVIKKHFNKNLIMSAVGLLVMSVHTKISVKQ